MHSNFNGTVNSSYEDELLYDGTEKSPIESTSFIQRLFGYSSVKQLVKGAYNECFTILVCFNTNRTIVLTFLSQCR
jgi:hypothetical protein